MIINHITDNENIWFKEVDKYLLTGLVPKDRYEMMPEFQYKY